MNQCALARGWSVHVGVLVDHLMGLMSPLLPNHHLPRPFVLPPPSSVAGLHRMWPSSILRFAVFNLSPSHPQAIFKRPASHLQAAFQASLPHASSTLRLLSASMPRYAKFLTLKSSMCCGSKILLIANPGRPTFNPIIPHLLQPANGKVAVVASSEIEYGHTSYRPSSDISPAGRQLIRAGEMNKRLSSLCPPSPADRSATTPTSRVPTPRVGAALGSNSAPRVPPKSAIIWLTVACFEPRSPTPPHGTLQLPSLASLSVDPSPSQAPVDEATSPPPSKRGVMAPVIAARLRRQRKIEPHYVALDALDTALDAMLLETDDSGSTEGKAMMPGVKTKRKPAGDPAYGAGVSSGSKAAKAQRKVAAPQEPSQAGSVHHANPAPVTPSTSNATQPQSGRLQRVPTIYTSDVLLAISPSHPYPAYPPGL
ncbi:hypothetical protein C8R47DRAFT_1083718 [Mycena vitilis]|nr:hypothetical protein C8R47DRAFT_1083718 [Mycena vitilis]